MNRELADALAVVEKKLREYEEQFNSMSSEVIVLENRKKSLNKDLDNAQLKLEEVEKERENLQLLIASKKKEQEIVIIGIKHSRLDVERRTEMLATREEQLDIREARVKDREAMYNIKQGK